MSRRDIEAILAIRLLIARAGSKDSMGWWDDDALSSHAEYVLQRIFPVAPMLAGRRLALEAAFSRHQALVPSDGRSVHLYRLTVDNQDRLEMRFHTLETIHVPPEPIRSLDELRVHLARLTGQELSWTVQQAGPTGAVRIGVPPCPSDTNPIVHRARTLAWAYLEAGAGQVLLPYCADNGLKNR